MDGDACLFVRLLHTCAPTLRRAYSDDVDNQHARLSVSDISPSLFYFMIFVMMSFVVVCDDLSLSPNDEVYCCSLYPLDLTNRAIPLSETSTSERYAVRRQTYSIINGTPLCGLQNSTKAR